jgi:hypothetical protein
MFPQNVRIPHILPVENLLTATQIRLIANTSGSGVINGRFRKNQTSSKDWSESGG